MRHYRHLEEIPQTEFNWAESMMSRHLPKRAFSHPLTANIILAMQTILAKGFTTASAIKKYWSF